MNTEQIKNKIQRDIETYQAQKEWTGKYQLTSREAGLTLTIEQKDEWILSGGRERFVDAAIEYAKNFVVTDENAAAVEKLIERKGIIGLYNAR